MFINNNANIIVDKSEIFIGDDTLIGPYFTCFDSNFHSINPKRMFGGQHSCKPVFIGKNVFIGANVTVLKGYEIGKNSVIGAGLLSVVLFPQTRLFQYQICVKLPPLNSYLMEGG